MTTHTIYYAFPQNIFEDSQSQDTLSICPYSPGGKREKRKKASWLATTLHFYFFQLIEYDGKTISVRYDSLKKPFLLSRYLNFYVDFLVEQKNGLIRNIKFKIYGVTTWLKPIIILILPNFLRIKDNETIKFDHLIEYNNRNIFLQKSCMMRQRNQFQTSYCLLKSL